MDAGREGRNLHFQPRGKISRVPAGGGKRDAGAGGHENGRTKYLAVESRADGDFVHNRETWRARSTTGGARRVKGARNADDGGRTESRDVSADARPAGGRPAEASA